MKLKNLLFAFFALVTVSSCSTAYKSGQTPDDVYYSPVRVVEENARRENRDNNRDNNQETRRYYDPEEREIRMAMRDRRWRDISYDYGYDYRYNPYKYGYNYGYYYNPYYYSRPVYLPGYAIVNPKTTAPRTTNLGSYNNDNTLVVSDGKAGQTRWVQPSRTYSNTNSSSGGSVIRRILNPTYSNNTSSGNRSSSSSSSSSNNSRTYSPAPSTPSSSSSSGSSSSGSSSSGTVTRPARGN